MWNGCFWFWVARTLTGWMDNWTDRWSGLWWDRAYIMLQVSVQSCGVIFLPVFIFPSPTFIIECLEIVVLTPPEKWTTTAIKLKSDLLPSLSHFGTLKKADHCCRSQHTWWRDEGSGINNIIGTHSFCSSAGDFIGIMSLKSLINLLNSSKSYAELEKIMLAIC